MIAPTLDSAKAAAADTNTESDSVHGPRAGAGARAGAQMPMRLSFAPARVSLQRNSQYPVPSFPSIVFLCRLDCASLMRTPHRSRNVRALILSACLAPFTLLEAGDDEWPRYGHDAALTGRTALKGDITSPRVAWKISLEGEQLDIELRPAPGRRLTKLTGRERPAPAARTLRQPGPRLLDLDGSGHPQPAAESHHERWADILPAVKGLERVAWDNTWTTAAICHLELFAHDQGLSHVGHLLDGRNGRTVWSRGKATAPGEFSWGYAGAVVATADVLGRGLDQLVNLYPVCFWIADGASGKLLATRELASRKLLPAWAAYGDPIVHDFDGDGNREVLLDSVYVLALLDRNGKPVWHGKGRRDYLTGKADDNVGETTDTKHALVDLDGDGHLELAAGGYGDGVRAIDPRDGQVLWSLPAARPTGRKCAAADIDGNGGEELIYSAGETLVALTGSRKQGRVLWSWEGPAALSLPAIADVDGDGKAEILIQSADGTVHCLDGPGPGGHPSSSPLPRR